MCLSSVLLQDAALLVLLGGVVSTVKSVQTRLACYQKHHSCKHIESFLDAALPGVPSSHRAKRALCVQSRSVPFHSDPVGARSDACPSSHVLGLRTEMTALIACFINSSAIFRTQLLQQLIEAQARFLAHMHVCCTRIIAHYSAFWIFHCTHWPIVLFISCYLSLWLADCRVLPSTEWPGKRPPLQLTVPGTYVTSSEHASTACQFSTVLMKRITSAQLCTALCGVASVSEAASLHGNPFCRTQNLVRRTVTTYY